LYLLFTGQVKQAEELKSNFQAADGFAAGTGDSPSNQAAAAGPYSDTHG